MALQPVTLNVPDHIYERARRIAERTAQPVEDVLLQELEVAFLPPLASGEQAELLALAQLSDDALWTIAREQMALDRQARLATLQAARDLAPLPAADETELSQLVEQSQQLMLRKGRAAALLTQRGYPITRADLRP